MYRLALLSRRRFKVTLNGNSYMMAEEALTLGVASMIFDVRTMKMVWVV